MLEAVEIFLYLLFHIEAADKKVYPLSNIFSIIIGKAIIQNRVLRTIIKLNDLYNPYGT